MKTKILLTFLVLLVLNACQKKDIRELRSDLGKQKELIAQLQSAINNINTDVKSLQAITTAIQNKVSVVSYVPTATGYTLTMSNGTTIDLKNGTNGTNGTDAPHIGVKIDTDGQYYWTLAGEFLLQNGQKLRVTGNNGTSGTNGITPLLRVDAATNYWMISYNNGNDWVVVKDNSGSPIVAVGATGQTGQTGPQGPGGVTGFGITDNGTAITITYNGSTYTLPKGAQEPEVYKMVLVTQKIAGSNILIGVDADPADRSDVWIDLNNDKKMDAGEKINNFGPSVSYPYPINVSQTITIYGKIKRLECYNNELTTLDISKNTALTYLACFNNNLTVLDVSKNTALTYLDCYKNQLIVLDFTKNTLLTELSCFENQLTVLDVSKNTLLTKLTCYENQLTALDVSKSTMLTTLNCNRNQITALDVSKNTSLKYLYCEHNFINSVEMGKLIDGLPTRTTDGYAYIGSIAADEANAIPTSASISAANAKKWRLFRFPTELTP